MSLCLGFLLPQLCRMREKCSGRLKNCLTAPPLVIWHSIGNWLFSDRSTTIFWYISECEEVQCLQFENCIWIFWKFFHSFSQFILTAFLSEYMLSARRLARSASDMATGLWGGKLCCSFHNSFVWMFPPDLTQSAKRTSELCRHLQVNFRTTDTIY